jgi:hypothetical protein
VLDPLLDFVLEFLLKGLGRVTLRICGQGERVARAPEGMAVLAAGLAVWLLLCLAVFLWAIA